MNKLAIVIVIGIGFGALAGVYWFRADRLDASDIAEIAAAQQRVEELQKQEARAEPSASTASEEPSEPQLDERGRPIPTKEERIEGAKKAIEYEVAKATVSVPPAVTIIPNESMPSKTPEKFTVLFETTKGEFAVEFQRDWAPNGADRMYELVMNKFFTDMRVFRVVEGFVVQFGIPGDPALSRKWLNSNIPDDRPKQSNTEGMFTFAAGGNPNSRSTQVFINLDDNSRLDGMGFAPVGKVIFGMDVVKSLYSGYGESITNLQDRIADMGNPFLDKEFPDLDSIKRAVFVSEIVDVAAIEKSKQEERKKQLEDLAAGKVTLGVSEHAPETFKVKFDCTMGAFVVECAREWSPNGVDRFYTLVKSGFYDGAKFFRVVPGFIVQFGLPAKPDIRGTWISSYIEDDPFTLSNTEGTLAFAKPERPNMRATQIFVNYGDNSASLDQRRFTPFAKVIEGMDVVRAINAEYGETPEQGIVRSRGNDYLDENFPRLDGIKTATIIDGAAATQEPAQTPAQVSAPAPASS